MPPNTRASAISATAAEKLENARVPVRTSEVTVNGVSSPNAAPRINAAAPLTVEWPEGYSGCAGVPAGKKSSHGTQVGSGSVLSFLSVSPKRMAVMGRQKTYLYLESQQAIAASAMVTFNKANKCAFSVKLKERLVEICAAIRFQYKAVLPAQNSASSDWSAERGDPEKTPHVLVSL